MEGVVILRGPARSHREPATSPASRWIDSDEIPPFLHGLEDQLADLAMQRADLLGKPVTELDARIAVAATILKHLEFSPRPTILRLLREAARPLSRSNLEGRYQAGSHGRRQKAMHLGATLDRMVQDRLVQRVMVRGYEAYTPTPYGALVAWFDAER